ncbi:MAG: hypothetical protein ACT4QC_14495 [Planctomycetaceae bacterium]
MPPATAPLTEPSALSERVVAVERDARAVVDALAGARRLRWLILLVLAAFVVAVCYAFYSLATRFQKQEALDELVKVAQGRLEARSDFFSGQARDLANNVGPELKSIFLEQVQHDTPAYLSAVHAQREKLAENLQSEIETRLQAHHRKLLDQHRQLLKEEFPSVDDERLHDAMVANLSVAVDRLVKKYYIEDLKSELTALYGAWDDFPIAAPTSGDDLPLEEQLYADLIELLKLKLVESPTTIADASGQ